MIETLILQLPLSKGQLDDLIIFLGRNMIDVSFQRITKTQITEDKSGFEVEVWGRARGFYRLGQAVEALVRDGYFQ